MAWHSPKFIFLEIVSNNVIERGESENRDPGARARVVYTVVNFVLKNSKIIQRHKVRLTPISNASSR